MTSLSFLNSSNYRIYNMEAAQKLGSIHASIFLSELINRQEYHRENKQDVFLEFEGKEWFYYTHDKGVERLAMSRKEQDTAIKILIKHGLIQKIQKGVPAKRYFWIDEEAVLNLFGLSKKDSIIPKREDKDSDKDESSKKDSSLTDSDKLDCPKGANWNDPNGQTGHIDKEPYKEPHKDTHTKKGSDKSDRVGDKSKKSKKVFYQIGSHVQLTREEYTDLCEQYGKAPIDTLIEEMNDYCAASKPKGYADYAAAIRQWMRKRLGQGVQPKKERKFAPCSDDNKAREYLEEGAKTAL